MNARGMSGRISEHTENSSYQICKPTLLAFLALGYERIDRQQGNISAEGFVDKRTFVVG
jgi:hypothetical protein